MVFLSLKSTLLPHSSATVTEHVQTSCEGYAHKKGRFFNTWKQRYFVLHGSDLTLSYYESKTSYEKSNVPKDSITLTALQEASFGSSHPFGVTMTGTRKGKKNNVVFQVSMDNEKDTLKWSQVAGNALSAKKAPTTGNVAAREDMLIGHHQAVVTASAGSSPLFNDNSTQVAQHTSNTKELLKMALRETTEATSIGSETASELSMQKELLTKAEQSLKESSVDLKHSDHLVNAMEHPWTNIAMHTHQRTPVAAYTPTSNDDPQISTTSSTTISSSQYDDTCDLSKLSHQLDVLKANGQEIGETIDMTSASMVRINEATEDVAITLKSQEQRTNKIS